MIVLTDKPIDPMVAARAVEHPGAGAVISFIGVTRDHSEGRAVTGLHYQAYEAMAVAVLQKICDEAVATWPGARLAVVHRLGDVAVGETSVVIAVSAPHRDAAYQASRFAIDQLKARVPIWKREHYVDGQDWKANERPLSPTARPKRYLPRAVDDYPDPDLNPYLKLHREFGPEVVLAEDGPGWRGRWAQAFASPAPLHVEIGPGNGFFLSGMAKRHPEASWLGIEIRFKRVVLTARKLRSAGVGNARVLRYDAHFLDDLFEPGEISALYVNHPDPWTKGRRAKHRLLRRPFAEWASRALKPNAQLRIKSDYKPNLDDFVQLIDGLPLRVLAQVDDVLADGIPWGEDDVRTNYQSKFDKRGLPVSALWIERS